jgi:hypothetical protein
LIANIIIIAVALVLSYVDNHRALVRRARRLGVAEPRFFDRKAHRAMARRGYQLGKRDPRFWLGGLIGGSIGAAGVLLGYYGAAFALCTAGGKLQGRLLAMAYRRSQKGTGHTDP